jgi:arylsulfatase A-like enzyme
MSLRQVSKSRNPSWKKVLNYFVWLMFASLLYISIDFFRSLDRISLYNLNDFDVLATFALVNFFAVFELILVALILLLIEFLTEKFLSRNLEVFSRGLLLCAFLLAWFYLLYWTLLKYIPANLQSRVLYGGVAFCIILLAILFWRMRPSVIKWFDETTQRLKPLVILLTAAILATAAYALIEPLFLTKSPQIDTSRTVTDPPNIILISLDALTAEDMSLYGYDLQTMPNLDREAQNWTVYENAHSTATDSIAELSTLMTGRYPYYDLHWRYGDLTNASNGWLNLAGVLKSMGYETQWYGYKTPGFYHFGSAFDRTICSNGLPAYLKRTRYNFDATTQTLIYPFAAHWLKILEYKGGMSCGTFTTLSDFITGRRSSSAKPFFIYTHDRGVHGVSYPAGEFLGAFLPESEGFTTRPEQREIYGQYDSDRQADVDKLRLRYDEAILNLDQRLNTFIQSLKQSNLYDNTLLIITADHGQNFNNGYSSHNTPLLSYAEHHIPLIIKYPHQTEGKRISGLVGTIDIAPTVLDVLNVAYPREWVDGQSLISLDASNNNERYLYIRMVDYVTKYLPTYAVIDSKGWKLVRRDANWFLFNTAEDPAEKNNLHQDIEEQNQYILSNVLSRFIQRMDYLYAGWGILKAPPL